MKKKEIATIFAHFEDRVESQYQDTMFYKNELDNALKTIVQQNEHLLAASTANDRLKEEALNLECLVERERNFAAVLRREVEEARAANRDIEHLRYQVSHEAGHAKVLTKLVSELRTELALANERGNILEAKCRKLKAQYDSLHAQVVRNGLTPDLGD